jgi:hypothetical protein
VFKILAVTLCVKLRIGANKLDGKTGQNTESEVDQIGSDEP